MFNHFSLSRDEATRTPDPYVPNVVRYQLRYIPIARKRVQRYCKNLKRVQFLWKNLLICQKTPTFAPVITKKTLGAIAQLVEQRTENPCVPGSIPGGTTCFKDFTNDDSQYPFTGL